MELWWSQENKLVTQCLVDLAGNGWVDLAITKRINDDIPYPPLAARISSLPALGIKEIGSVFRLDHSALDGGDMLGSDGFLGMV